MEGNPGNFCLWINESWALEFQIQLKESGYQVLLTKIPDSRHWCGIQNPRQSWNSLSRGEKDSLHARRK